MAGLGRSGSLCRGWVSTPRSEKLVLKACSDAVVLPSRADQGGAAPRPGARAQATFWPGPRRGILQRAIAGRINPPGGRAVDQGLTDTEQPGGGELIRSSAGKV